MNALALGVKLLQYELNAVIIICAVLTQLSISKKKTCRSVLEVLPAMLNRGDVSVEYVCLLDNEKSFLL